ncbi:hypothetical protein BBta_4574 [Bradyrhizobium sp. BTAi1]|nr:hypothetical protein BBta_4574 [Bradyrhizobium sp. BTAi1]
MDQQLKTTGRRRQGLTKGSNDDGQRPVMQNFKTEPTDMDHFPGDKTGPAWPSASEPLCCSS